MDVRSTYLEGVGVVIDLLTHPAVERSWDHPSALTGWRISGLSGHLVRAVTTVEQYLEGAATPERAMTTPGAYFANVIDTSDLDSDLHRIIRERGDEMASAGLTSLTDTVVSSAERLHERLPAEPADRRVSVLNGLVLTLDDYLATRLVELVVHADDLAVSVGIDTPPFPPAAYWIVGDALLDVARQRHGDLAVIRALARRERDRGDVLPVF